MIAPTNNFLIIQRRVARADDETRAPFRVLECVFDEKVGRYQLLVVCLETGRLATWNSNETYLLPDDSDDRRFT